MAALLRRGRFHPEKTRQTNRCGDNVGSENDRQGHILHNCRDTDTRQPLVSVYWSPGHRIFDVTPSCLGTNHSVNYYKLEVGTPGDVVYFDGKNTFFFL